LARPPSQTLLIAPPDILAALRRPTCKRKKRREKQKKREKGKRRKQEKRKLKENEKEEGALNDFLLG